VRAARRRRAGRGGAFHGQTSWQTSQPNTCSPIAVFHASGTDPGARSSSTRCSRRRRGSRAPRTRPSGRRRGSACTRRTARRRDRRRQIEVGEDLGEQEVGALLGVDRGIRSCRSSRAGGRRERALRRAGSSPRTRGPPRARQALPRAATTASARSRSEPW
jgi:hypothetical protein